MEAGEILIREQTVEPFVLNHPTGHNEKSHGRGGGGGGTPFTVKKDGPQIPDMVGYLSKGMNKTSTKKTPTKKAAAKKAVPKKTSTKKTPTKKDGPEIPDMVGYLSQGMK